MNKDIDFSDDKIKNLISQLDRSFLEKLTFNLLYSIEDIKIIIGYREKISSGDIAVAIIKDRMNFLKALNEYIESNSTVSDEEAVNNLISNLWKEKSD